MITRNPRPPASALRRRRGAVLPLFAVLLPVLVLLAAFAVNVAYMQLTTTELKVATDSAARAAGRAWSEHQNINQALTFARDAAAANRVAGQPLLLRTDAAHDEIEFGISSRSDNGYGRYTFTREERGDVAAGRVEATSVRINAHRTTDSRSGSVALLMGGVGGLSAFQPNASSVCTQVDRDISLVLDRSGSMAFYNDEETLYNTIYGLYQRGRISYSEYVDATRGYEGNYSTRNRNFYERWYNSDVRSHLSGDMLEYAQGLNNYNWSSGDAPPHSRWDLLDQAVDAFLNVLDATDQAEQVSLATFASSARLDLVLQTNYDNIRGTVNGIRPYSGTSIGEGMQGALQSLLDGLARPYAAKTIVVLTDGVNNAGEISPTAVASSIVASHNVTIHTVTFTQGSDQDAMRNVATIGGGKHFHADTGNELIAIFEEIANNLPTIITE